MEAILKTKLGKFYIQYSDQGLSLLSFSIPSKVDDKQKDKTFLADLTKQLNEFSEGKRREFNIKLDIVGTDFQKRVWRELLKIKHGSVTSYGEIAKKLKVTGGQRAVGGANNRNKIPIIIPCHRVIRANGELGGYAGGLKLKEKLLAIEGVALK
ncbi:methylated-DNA--[protein]-cysteine S-methyltransferase [Halobacteriovorax marinus]|uniref:methylated-DNA--[protein]-cysteine S-methyltransferase n=1 Tax=Halobacteriovorax marinus TaxID=97084 RepID=UPI003A8DC239